LDQRRVDAARSKTKWRGVLARSLDRVDHIAVAVENLAVAVRWYSEVLASSASSNGPSKTADGMISAVMQAGPIIFVLLQGTNPESQIAGVQHVALRVGQIDRVVRGLTPEVWNSARTGRGSGLRQVFTKRSSETDSCSSSSSESNWRLYGRKVDGLFRQLEASDEF